jgi:hypothetical protein
MVPPCLRKICYQTYVPAQTRREVKFTPDADGKTGLGPLPPGLRTRKRVMPGVLGRGLLPKL